MQEKIQVQLPAWAKQQESFIPDQAKAKFLERSLLRMTTVLKTLRQSPDKRLLPIPAWLTLIILVILTIAVSASHSMLLIISALASVMLILCILPAFILKRCLSISCLAAALSLAVLLPAFFLGQQRAVLLLPLRTFITANLWVLFISVYPWNKITASLRQLHIPDTAIAIFDMTLKFILLLGETAQQRLWALKLRSVGKGTEKAMPAVIGSTFIRAKELSEDMYQAMVCRGYTGEYKHERNN